MDFFFLIDSSTAIWSCSLNYKVPGLVQIGQQTVKDSHPSLGDAESGRLLAGVTGDNCLQISWSKENDGSLSFVCVCSFWNYFYDYYYDDDDQWTLNCRGGVGWNSWAVSGCSFKNFGSLMTPSSGVFSNSVTVANSCWCGFLWEGL